MGLGARLQQISDIDDKSLKKILQTEAPHYLMYAYSLIRSVNYTAQASILPWLDLFATGKKREAPKNFLEHIKEALPKINELLWQDSENIMKGVYPREVLKPEPPLKHLKRIPKLVVEAINSSRRRENNITSEFASDSHGIYKEAPDYYSRNFHFQNSGYLSDASAEIYEHQVEMLFSGTANAMRRLIISEIKSKTGSADGHGLHFLEIACGSGTLTEFMALAFPKAKITCIDLSPYYLKLAQSKLKKFPRVHFLEANAENLPFKDATFDVVYSCYLFHELPENIRLKVMQESIRVLKVQGIVGAVDSLQIGDDESLDWALKQFPKDFHEPFYKNYTQNSLEELFISLQLQNMSKKIGFLSKSVVGQK